MTRLVAFRNGESFTLDAPDQKIELNFQIEDLQTPASRTAPFSLTFKLPFTKRNTDYFGYVQDVQVVDSAFDFSRKSQATLFDGGLEIMDGILQVTQVDLQTQEFECRFYSSLVDLYDSLRGKKWRDMWVDSAGNLDCPLDHTLNNQNVRAAWNGTNPSGIDPNLVPPGTIQYPLTDNGNHPVGDYVQPACYFDVWESGLQVGNLHPAIKVTWLLDAMFEYAGYTRTSDDFFNDTTVGNDKLFCIVGLHSRVVDTRTSFGFQASVSVDTNTSGNPNLVSQFLLVGWDTSTPPNYDPDDLFQTGTYLTLNLTGIYLLEFTISTADTLNGPWTSNLIAFDGITGDIMMTTAFSAGAADGDGGVTVIMQLTYTGTELVYFQIETAADAVFDVSMVYLDLFGNNGADGVLDFATIMGDEPLDAWLKGFVETYNLVLKIDEHTKEVTFFPYDEYTNSALNLDWTEKVDIDGPMDLLPATEYQKARLNLLPAETQDHRSVFYEATFGQRKGQFIYNAPNDFSTDETVINDFFGLMRLTYLKWFVNPYTGQAVDTSSFGLNTNLIISELWSSAQRLETDYESLPPLLCYYHGIQPTLDQGQTILLGGQDVTGILPLFTPVSGIEGDSTRISLEYALTAPDLVDTSVIGIPTSGLLETYWGNYIQQIYGSDARLLKCQLRLDPRDVYNLDFRDTITIKNQEFRLISLSNYVVGSVGMVNATLFKGSNKQLYDCELRATLLNDGLVRWRDNTGTTVPGNAICCSANGWNWFPDRQACKYISRRTADQYGLQYTYSGEAIARGGQGISEQGVRTVYENYLSGTLIEEKWEMIAQTVDANATFATGIVQAQREFYVGSNRTVNLTIDWLAVQTDGASRGQSASGEDVFLIDTVNNSSSKTSGNVYARGVAGLSVNIVEVDATSGTLFRVTCSGLSATNFDWFISITTQEYDQSLIAGGPIPSYAEFQDNDLYEFENGDQMEWNA